MPHSYSKDAPLCVQKLEGNGVERIPIEFGEKKVDLQKLFPKILADQSLEESSTEIVGLCRHEGRVWVVYEWSCMMARSTHACPLTEKEERAFFAEVRRIHSPLEAANVYVKRLQEAAAAWRAHCQLLADRLPKSLRTFADASGWTKSVTDWWTLPENLLAMQREHSEGRPYVVWITEDELESCGFKSLSGAARAFRQLPAAWMNSIRVKIDRKLDDRIGVNIFPPKE